MTTLAEALAPKSDQVNADDLITGPRTITITDARIVKSERQMRITLSFDGDGGKPFKPCKTMGRAMVMVWAVTEESQFVGKSITIYRDPTVKFGDQGEVGGIRISHMSHIDRPASVKLTVSQGKKSIFVFQPLVAEVRQLDASRHVTGNAFVDWYNTRLDECHSPADIAALIEESADDMATMKDKAPKMHSRLTTSTEMRRLAVAPEGRDETDTGEQVTLASAQDELDKCTTPKAAQDALRALLLHLGDEDATKLLAYGNARMAVLQTR